MNREQWLNKLMTKVAPILEKHTEGATKNKDTWRVSCGWPGGGARNKRIGECWSSTSSKAGRTEIFISPLLDTPEQVDHVLLHEMIHAAVGIKEQHHGKFSKMAKGIGLVGRMTCTTAGDELREKLNSITAAMPPYPHSGMTALSNGKKKQTTRMVKLLCTDCGYIVRTTAKWLEVGVPRCCCGTEFTTKIN